MKGERTRRRDGAKLEGDERGTEVGGLDVGGIGGQKKKMVVDFGRESENENASLLGQGAGGGRKRFTGGGGRRGSKDIEILTQKGSKSLSKQRQGKKR